MGLKILIKKESDTGFINEWKLLWEKSENANVFNSYDWYLTCKASNEKHNYVIYACYKDEKLIGVFPAWKTKKFGVSVISSLNSDFTIGVPILLENLSEKEVLEELIKFISSKNNLYIGKLNESITKHLFLKFPQSLLSLLFASPFVDFSEDPFLTTSSSLIRDMKKTIKKTNGLRFDSYDVNDDLEKYLDIIFEIDQHSGKVRRSRDIFSKPEMRSFYRNILKHCKKYTVITILSLGEEPIAYTFNLKYKNQFVAYQCSYLQKYNKLSPGKISVYELINALKNENVKMLDFGPGMVPYKLRFSQKYSFRYDFYYSNKKSSMFWWKSINFARRCKQMILPERNSRDHEFLFRTFP